MSKINSTTAKAVVRMFDGEKFDTYKVGGKKHLAAQERRAAFEAAKANRKAWNSAAADWARSVGVTPSGSAWSLIRVSDDLGTLNVKALRKANKAEGLAAPTEVAVKAAKARLKARKEAAKAGVPAAEQGEILAKATKKATKGDRKVREAKASLTEVEIQAADAAEKRRVADVRAAEKKAAKRAAKEAAAKAEAEALRNKRSEAARKAYQTRLANGTAVRANGRFVKAETVEVEAPTGTKALFWAQMTEAGLAKPQIKAAWKLARKAA